MRAFQVLTHVVRIYEQLIQHFRGQVEHIVQEDAAVGDHDPFNGGVRDIPFVPQRDVFEGGDGIPAQHTCKAGDPFAGDRIAFVRHCRRAFLPFGKELFRFEHFGLLQVADFRGKFLE